MGILIAIVALIYVFALHEAIVLLMVSNGYDTGEKALWVCLFIFLPLVGMAAFFRAHKIRLKQGQ